MAGKGADPISTYLWLLFALCLLGNITGGVVSTLMSVYLPVILEEVSQSPYAWGMKNAGSLVSAIYFAGWTAGGFLWGWAGDKTGRSRSLALSVLTFGLAVILTSFTTSWPTILILRFISGFGVGGMLVANTTLLSETWPEKSRAVFMGIVSVGFPVGIMLSGAANLVFPEWRNGFLTGIVPLILGFAMLLYVRDSHSWIYSMKAGGRLSNGKFFSGQGRDLLNGSVIFGSMLIGLWAIFSWVPTWIQSLLEESDGHRERGLAMMMLGMGGIAGGFSSGWVAGFLGLRKAMLLIFGSCFIISITIFGLNTVYSPVILAELAVLSFVFGISQGLLSVFIPLLFPVPVRATATGFCFNTGRIFTTLAVFFVGAMVSVLGGYGKSLFIFSFIFIPGFVFILFTDKIRTRSQNVQEIHSDRLTLEQEGNTEMHD